MQNFEQIENVLKEVTQKVAEIRKQSGSTQIHIAEILGVEVRNITRIDRSDFTDFKLLCEYCDIMGIELSLTYETH